MPRDDLRFIDLGRLAYRDALGVQRAHAEEVLASREGGEPELGRVLMVEHPAVITISARAGAAENLLASPETLACEGVDVEPTDRGGDITYHGPGQLVVYPILDLNRLMLNLHDYMRLLEQAVIDACAALGVSCVRDPGATGVWTEHEGVPAKIAAMGVRVRRWVSMHGLALNVEPDLRHFGLIVPCGLAGRSVTSLRAVLGARAPSMEQASAGVRAALEALIRAAAARADAHRAGAASGA